MQRQSFLNALDLKGQVLTELKCKKRKKRRKHSLTMYKKEKVIFNFLDDFRSKMIYSY